MKATINIRGKEYEVDVRAEGFSVGVYLRGVKVGAASSLEEAMDIAKRAIDKWGLKV